MAINRLRLTQQKETALAKQQRRNVRPPTPDPSTMFC